MLLEIWYSRYFCPYNLWMAELPYNPLINYAPASRGGQYRIKKWWALNIYHAHLEFRNLFILVLVMPHDVAIQGEVTYRSDKCRLLFYLSKYLQNNVRYRKAVNTVLCHFETSFQTNYHNFYFMFTPIFGVSRVKNVINKFSIQKN